MAKQLVAVGFSNGQAEAVTSAVRDAQGIDLGGPATKADVLALKNDLRAELIALQTDLKADLHATRDDLKAAISAAKVQIIKWIVGVGIAQAVFLVAMIRLMY